MRICVLTQDTPNIGDDMQNYAASRLLPRVDGYVNREELSQVTEDTVVIMSAWFKHDTKDWPPSPHVKPIFVGFHANQKELVTSHVDYLRTHGPIGCRDFRTLHWLQEVGVPAYFSGCITLTLDDYEPLLPAARSLMPVPTSVDVAMVDVGTDCDRAIPGIGRGSIARMTHQLALWHNPVEQRMSTVMYLLNCYKQAKAVVTTRLHAYLPAVAMGTTAILLVQDHRTEPYVKSQAGHADRIRDTVAERLTELLDE